MMSLLMLIFGALLTNSFKDASCYNIILSIVIFLFLPAFFLDIQKNETLSKYDIPIALSAVARIALCFYDGAGETFLHLPLVGGVLRSDHLRFYETAILYMNGKTSSYGGLFPKVLSVLFSVSGTSRLLADFFVTLFAIATIVITAYILEKFAVSYEAKLISMYLVSLLPNYILLSCVIRRETIITFFISLSLLCFINWLLYNKEIQFILAIAFGLCSSAFHGAVGLIVLVYIFALIIYDPEMHTFNLKATNIIGAFILIGLFVLFYSRFGSTFFAKLERLSSGSASSVRDVGGSSYARYVGDAKTPLRMVIYQIPRFVYYMFSPFPWDWRGLSDIFAFVFSSLFYLLIIINSIVYIRNTQKRDKQRSIVIILLICVIFIACIFSWGVTNTGTATRHRDKLIVFYAVLFALTYERRLTLSFRDSCSL